MEFKESMMEPASLDVPRKVFLWSVSDAHTTARYFEKAISDSGIDVVYGNYPDLNEIQENDLVWFIDPSPQQWFEHYHLLPCPAFGYLIDTHLDDRYRSLLVPFFDRIFVAQKEAIQKTSAFSSAEWLPLACDPSLFKSSLERSQKWEVGFVGQWGRSHHPRHQFLKTIRENFEMNPQNRFYPPTEMAEVYQSSAVVVNHSVKGDLNMRVFEAMASGSLLVTDQIGNGLESLFKEDVHCVFYRSTEEAVAKIRYYLEHEDERNRITAAGRENVFLHHTYFKRWEYVLEKWRSARKSFRAQIRETSSSARFHQLGKIAAAHGDLESWWKNYRNVFWRIDLLAVGMRTLRRYLHHQRHLNTNKRAL